MKTFFNKKILRSESSPDSNPYDLVCLSLSLAVLQVVAVQIN